MFTHGEDEEDREGELQGVEHQHHRAPDVLQAEDVRLVYEEVAHTNRRWNGQDDGEKYGDFWNKDKSYLFFYRITVS